jgi:hypothetical protein
MPRKVSVLNQLIDTKQQELIADRAQLAQRKVQAQAGGTPDELLQKQINALRVTIANGAEDLEDLKTELKMAIDYEASPEGQRKRADTREKLKAMDALARVCVATAAAADRAASAHWAALRRHFNAHQALRTAMAEAYGAVTEGSGFDVHGDQVFLLQTYSNLSNSAPAIAEWVVEALKGYELENHIQVHGITLHHNQHETLEAIDGAMLNRMMHRMKEIAVKCGHEVHAPNDPDLEPLRQQLLQYVLKEPLA